MAATCTTDGLLKAYPCFKCLSATELKAVLIMILAQLVEEKDRSSYSFPGDIDTLLSDSACFSCLSEQETLQAIVSLAAQAASWEEQTMAEIRDKVKCLLCAPPKQIDAALLLLLCRMAEIGLAEPAQ